MNTSRFFNLVWGFKPGTSQHKLTAVASEVLMPTQVLRNLSHMQYIIPCILSLYSTSFFSFFLVIIMFGVSVVLMLLISLSHHIGSWAIIVSLEGAEGCPTGSQWGHKQGRQRDRLAEQTDTVDRFPDHLSSTTRDNLTNRDPNNRFKFSFRDRWACTQPYQKRVTIIKSRIG